jgi:hypothetical protein
MTAAIGLDDDSKKIEILEGSRYQKKNDDKKENFKEQIKIVIGNQESKRYLSTLHIG